MAKSVVVVESPAKAKTINKYLGNDYVVLASYGHVRDLPSKNGSVNPDDSFAMTWEIDQRSEKHINEISRALKGSETLYLATDPDREGEAISWHVQEILKERGALKTANVERVVFHEITKSAVKQAMANPRKIDQGLVEAYLARRALDYLVGFTLSPVLWRKLPGSRSAGRVQSVALRLIVDREQEIEAFIVEEYWTVLANLKTPRDQDFSARLTHLHGKKLEKFSLPNKEAAEAACAEISAESFNVASIDKRQVKRHPAPPFTTSTLQQEASRKLGFGASRTMQTAQKLYEGFDIDGETTGLITYMRTDSTQMSQEAIVGAREYIEKDFGKQYLPDAPRLFKGKAKNAQEAHEAIRPTQLSRHPRDLVRFLDDAQLKLYELIWKRALASQMESALFDQVSIDLASKDKNIGLRATGSTLVFDGFLKLYQEGVDDSVEDSDEKLLPVMNEGEAVKQSAVIPNQHFTQPPPRFSEASLVKKLEELGIGRPSTYASIIQVLQDRDYVRIEKRQFHPEDRGRIVSSFLKNFFERYVQYEFTANLEEQLDEISSGHLAWKEVMKNFWRDFKINVDTAQGLQITDVINRLEEDLNTYLFKNTESGTRECPLCKKGQVNLKLSRFGAFLGCSEYPECRYTRPIGNGTSDAGNTPSEEPIEIGLDPETNDMITLRKGPYGFYLQWGTTGVAAPEPEKEVNAEDKPKKKTKAKPKAKAAPKPKRISIPTTIELSSIDLDKAMRLKELPKLIGENPESGLPVSLGIGRFGPYVKHGDQFVSIPKSDDVLNLDLPRALEIIAAKAKQGDTKKGKVFKAKAKPKAVKKSKKSESE